VVELQAAPAVAQRDGDGTLGVALTDDESVEFGHDFAGGEVGHTLFGTGGNFAAMAGDMSASRRLRNGCQPMPRMMTNAPRMTRVAKKMPPCAGPLCPVHMLPA